MKGIFSRAISAAPLFLLGAVFSVLVLLFADFDQGMTLPEFVVGLCGCGAGSVAAILASGSEEVSDRAVLPVVYLVSYVYGVLAVVCAAVFIAVGIDNWRAFAAVEIILLLLMIALQVAFGCLGRKSESETLSMKSRSSFARDGQMVMGRCLDKAKSRGLSEESCKAIEKVIEKVRFCDPSNSDASLPLENRIMLCLGDIELAVAEGDSEKVVGLCSDAVELISERNRLCVIAG